MLRLSERTSFRFHSGGGAGSPRRARLRRLVRCATLEADRVRLVERERFAAAIDRDLQRACRAEARVRLCFGGVAGTLLRRRGYRRLGFVRLTDYARERLGISARALESAAWVAARLADLPEITAAFHAGVLSWTKARMLAGIAYADDEQLWLSRARSCSAESLAASIQTQRNARGEAPLGDPESELLDGEPSTVLRLACPSRLRSLWRYACELASRMAGGPLATWQAAELIAAEGIASRPAGGSVGDRVLLAFLRLTQRLQRSGPESTCDRPPPAVDGHNRTESSSGPAVGEMADAPPAPLPLRAAAPPTSDPFEIDARLREAMDTLRRTEPEIGRLLRIVVDHRLYRSLGSRSLDHYVRERLGISLRKAWALVKIERGIRRAVPFADAYEHGELSWVRALLLLPVVDRSTAHDWIARANVVTVRRLTDEVNWVLDRRDLVGPDGALTPPPLESPLVSPRADALTDPPKRVESAMLQRHETSPARIVQIGALADRSERWTRNVIAARRELEVSDGEIRFTGPTSVVALLRDALEAFSAPGEPRWVTLERLLTRVVTDWEAEPQHRDPVFARDRWRCAVPACSGRRNLHDHHIRFRSHGGGNQRSNRITVCAAHHIHGIHAGTVRARGAVPAVRWELGVRPDGPPLVSCIGDRYV